MVSLYMTCKNDVEWEKIADEIMRERAAGCINMIPTRSVWRDDTDDSIVRSDEVILFVKTIDSKVQQIEDIVRRTSSYRAPCIAMFSAARINREYKEWLGRVVACFRHRHLAGLLADNLAGTH